MGPDVGKTRSYPLLLALCLEHAKIGQEPDTAGTVAPLSLGIFARRMNSKAMPERASWTRLTNPPPTQIECYVSIGLLNWHGDRAAFETMFVSVVCYHFDSAVVETLMVPYTRHRGDPCVQQAVDNRVISLPATEHVEVVNELVTSQSFMNIKNIDSAMVIFRALHCFLSCG